MNKENKKLSQEEVWDKIAQDWNKFRVKITEEVREFLKDKRGNILDLGCGTGRNFVKVNGTIYGIDFSKEMIKYAKANAEKKGIKAKFLVSSLENLGFKNNFFDSAIYIASLHCIVSKKEREDSLKELFRVLKPNSKALITVWSKNHKKLVNHPKDAKIGWKTKTENLYRYYYIYDKEELKKLLESVGFEIDYIKEDDKNIIVIVKKPTSV